MRVFFFYKKNPRTGETTDVVEQADEHTASLYLRQPRFFEYIGWSDGRFVKAVGKIKMPKDKEKGDTPMELDDVTRKKLLEAQAAELEFAKNNPNKSLPRDTSAVDINGGPITDPYLASALRSRAKNG